ncbi:SYT16 protein, partial [Crypturellus undulatus]|nr:SYT16 protein [Crypturellus undulatus]
MASEAAQNFLQPLSSWISQIYEAIQQAGDSISASLLSLSGAGRKSGGEKRNQDLEDNAGDGELYSEDSEDERDLDLWDEEYLHPGVDGHVPLTGPGSAAQGSDVALQRQKRVQVATSLAEQCAESPRPLAASGLHCSGEDVQPLKDLPTIAEVDRLPRTRTREQQPGVGTGGSLNQNKGKA